MFRRIGGPVCLKCGKPVADESVYCPDCMEEERYFTAGRSLWQYDKNVRESIYAFKYGGRREYAGYYGECLGEAFGRTVRQWDVQALIPVPVHENRKKQRGFNQAQLPAEALAETLARQGTDLPVRAGVLLRRADTAPQKALDPVRRRENLSRAFYCPEGGEVPEKALLVDDIFTTGATADAAARALRKNGAGQVFFLALAAGGSA